MAPSIRLLKSSQIMRRAELADFLEGIAARIREGQVALTSGADSVTLDLPEQVNLDVQAISQEKTRGTKMELEIEIDWYPDGSGRPAGIELA